MIYIYSTFITNRLTYTLDFCFKSKGKSYQIITDIAEFENAEGLKINYSNVTTEALIQIKPVSLLFEINSNSKYSLKFSNNQWSINNKKDSFSIIFYMLTCYDAYTLTKKDKHNRHLATDSFLYLENRLNKPNADIIVKDLWEALTIDYTTVQNQFKTTITFDIDNAWAFKNKGFFRSLASDIKDLLKGKCIKDKLKVRLNKKTDPFDTYDFINNLSKKKPVICFFLLGDWGKFDKNINWKKPQLKQLIKKLSESCQLGIHPSYKSYLSKTKIEKELGRLNILSESHHTKSRQHFLKLSIPKSYELLESIGITDDYSMGFADNYGFRSGTCFTYPFFNLKTNTISKLLIHPITYMDGTLNQYLNLSIEESKIVILDLKKEVKNVGGTFCPLWHNETIGDNGIWRGWLEVFKVNF